jgi:hypothetical protein
MKRKVLLILIGLNAFFINTPVIAQDSLLNHKIGFMAGNGIQYIGQLLGNNSHAIALNKSYYYQVTFYQLQYSYTISRKKTLDIEILVQPQYNSTKYKVYDEDDDSQFLTGYETGLNIGLLLRKKIVKGLFNYYVLISTGPHYTSGTPHRQSSGFLFSDNLCLGINLKLYKHLYIDIRPGFRHISNLGFKIPNAGVNTMTLAEGLLMNF